MIMIIESKNRSFYVQVVSQKTQILTQMCVCPDNQKRKRSEKYKWFDEQKLTKFWARLQDITLARILSGETVEGPKDVREAIQGPESIFHILYTFKNGASNQYVLTKSPVTSQYHQETIAKSNYSGGGYSEYFTFPEKLVVLISLEPIRLGTEISEQQVTLAMLKERKEKSKYFKLADGPKLTSSAVKKQANLRSIVNKMKTTTEKGHEATTTEEQNITSNKQSNGSLTKTIANECDSTTIHSERACEQEIRSPGDTGSISRKRTREDSEKTGSETSQPTEKDDFVSPKKPVLRTKRQKIVHKGSKKVSKKTLNGNLVNTDTVNSDICPSVDDPWKNSSDENRCTVSTTHSEKSLETTSEFIDNKTVMEVTAQDIPVVVVHEKTNTKQHETITIRDVVPSFDNVKEVDDLTNEHIEYLIQKLQKKLKSIFKGKEYCRRHEDYKKGGRSKGDLAFQVRFGLYSEDQHDTIMQELMSIFCARHNKYIDYLSKVLLPETFVLIYQEVFGGNHDEVERKLMGIDKNEKDTTATDASLLSE